MNATKFLNCRSMTLLGFALLAGCASVPKDLGRSDVDTLTRERGVPESPPESPPDEGGKLVASLAAAPLTADSAVRIALVNNPELKAAYARLGIAAADVYEAGRIRNPILSFSTLDTNEPGERNLTTFGLTASFSDLLTLTARKRLAESEFTATKQEIGAAVFNVATDTEAAFYAFVAAKRAAVLQAQIAGTQELSLELAQQYHAAGNLTPRDMAAARAVASEARLAALETEADVQARRAELAALLGLPAADDWDAPAQLPAPLEREDDVDGLIELAQQSRLDLAAAQTRAELLADRLGVEKRSGWLGELDVGVEHERETDGAELTGPAIEWEIPLFSRNYDGRLRARAELQTAVAEARHLAMEIQNAVRLAHAAMRNAGMRANEYRERLIPARMEVVEHAQEEENFMLIGAFELLETKREEYEAYLGHLEAVRDYWLARTELARAVGSVLPGSMYVGEEYLGAEDYAAPKTGGTGHSGHGMKTGSGKPAVSPTGHDAHDHRRHTFKGDTQ